MNTPASYPHAKPLPTTGTLPATVRRFTASLGPNAYDDAYPVTWDVLIGGGFRVVDDTTERDGINNDWRKEGMQVYSVSDGKFYTLQSDLLSWTDTSPLLKSGGTLTGQLVLTDGTATNPAIRFSDADTGFYQAAADRIYMSCAGTAVGYFNSTSLRLVDGTASTPSHGFTASSSSGMYHIGSGTLGFSVAGTRAASFSADSLALGSSGDTILVRAASDTLALRRGSNLQNLRIYGTYTDDANGEWLAIESGGTVFDIKTVANGTGTANALRLGVNGSTQWQINTSGHWISSTDNLYDIGASGATRPRTGYFGTNVVAGSNILAGSSGILGFSSRGGLRGSADGVHELIDSAGTSYGRLCFGGTGPTSPALKRSSAILQNRLADDSDYAAFEADTIRTAKARTVAQLPAAGSAGRRAYVTDANATTYLSIVAGGGANIVPVFDNGTNWVIA